MTNRQTQTLEFLKRYISEHGKAPTLKEIGLELNIHPCSARDLLDRLHNHGAIIRNPAKHRNITLV